MKGKTRLSSVFICVCMITAAFSLVIQAGNPNATTLSADVTMEPKTINLKSQGRWVTAFIELPLGYDVNDIDVSSILLEGIIPADEHHTTVGDHDGDGTPDLMVKFSKSALEDILLLGNNTVIISGELTTGERFEGEITIEIKNPPSSGHLGIARHPDSVRDAQNNLHKVWQEPVEGQYEIFYANNIDQGREGNMGIGNDWNPSIRISHTPVDSVWPSIEIYQELDMIFVSWTEETANGDIKYYSISWDMGTHWMDSNYMFEDISLKADVFNPIKENPDIPKELSLQKGEGYYIVQFTTPTLLEYKEEIETLGGILHGYIPNNAYIVGMSDKVKKDVENLAFIRWVGIYQPAYKLSVELLYIVENGGLGDNITLDVQVFDDIESVKDEVAALGGTIESESDPYLRVTIEDTRVDEMAFIPEVAWMQTVGRVEFSNDVAVNDDIMNIRESWNHPTNPLTGDGQIIAVLDSGIDTGIDDPLVAGDMHPDFDNRIIKIFDYSGDGADDNEYHGTHVAGSALGNGAASGGQIKGVAYKAELVFQAIGKQGGGAVMPTPVELTSWFQDAYNKGARIHTNSWRYCSTGEYFGLPGSWYEFYSQTVDDFMWNNPDIIILFNAGNEGDDFDGDGVVDNPSMAIPATAKNCITVGATENLRPIFNLDTYGSFMSGNPFPANPIFSDPIGDNAEGMAAFSSRGPTADGRIKPDVVAPGTWILSARSGASPSVGWGLASQGGYDPALDPLYGFMGGTSMATPLTAGSVALIRQYYTEVEVITPSGALLKATLINGATDIMGQYTPDETGSIPNGHEGWGRVDLTNSIFPASPRILNYEDVTAGFPTGAVGISDVYTYSVAAGEPLRITLAWTDFPANPAAGNILVNNLDLRVTAPDGTTVYRGNVFANGQSDVGGVFDTLNNVENVYIDNPQDGDYTIEVISTNIPEGPQPYALVVSYSRSSFVDIGGPYYMNEGSGIIMTFTASASPDLVHFRWDFDSDGIWDTPWATDPTITNFFLFGDDYHNIITVEAWDGHSYKDVGGVMVPDIYTDTADLYVENVIPAVEFLGTPYTGSPGSPVTLTGHATDPGSDDLRFIWDWGDGSASMETIYFNDGVGPDPYPSPEVNPMDVTEIQDRIYPIAGTYIVTLMVWDDDMEMGYVTVDVIIS